MSRVTPPPDRTAAGARWYASREPIVVDGMSYERAGASVFFDGNTMVAISRIAGVPVYADVTREPGAIVYIPIGRGLVQPYERRRGRDGTAPAIDEHEQRTTIDEREGRAPVGRTTGTSAISSVASGRVWTALPPVGSRGIWIPLEGRVWTSAGSAELLDPARLVRTGSYAGFPVYRAPGRDDVVFVPVVEGGLVTPYRRTDSLVEQDFSPARQRDEQN